MAAFQRIILFFSVLYALLSVSAAPIGAAVQVRQQPLQTDSFSPFQRQQPLQTDSLSPFQHPQPRDDVTHPLDSRSTAYDFDIRQAMVCRIHSSICPHAS